MESTVVAAGVVAGVADVVVEARRTLAETLARILETGRERDGAMNEDQNEQTDGDGQQAQQSCDGCRTMMMLVVVVVAIVVAFANDRIPDAAFHPIEVRRRC